MEPFTRNHPRSLHIWWAPRPLVTARAILFAQLVDDPSSHPDRFPTAEAQRVERERLRNIIERLVVWENKRDQALLAEVHAEILKSTGGNPPPILDPFAGGPPVFPGLADGRIGDWEGDRAGRRRAPLRRLDA